MSTPILILIGTQVLFSLSDLMGRQYMASHSFTVQSFLTGWFALYFFIRTVAMFGMLYVFSRIELGTTMALFGALSILAANALGFLVLREVLSVQAYVGVVLAVIAFFVLATR